MVAFPPAPSASGGVCRLLSPLPAAVRPSFPSRRSPPPSQSLLRSTCYFFPQPVDGVGDVTICSSCAPSIPIAQRPISRLDRHFSACPHGIRLSGTCHDPAVHALIVCLDALFGAASVLAERPSGRAALEQFMAGPGAGLRHRPDAVIAGLDGPGSYCLIDVKTLDPCGATHVATDHTDRRRQSAHIAVARRSARDEYGDLPPRMRLVILAVSIYGSFGPDALRFSRPSAGEPVTQSRLRYLAAPRGRRRALPHLSVWPSAMLCAAGLPRRSSGGGGGSPIPLPSTPLRRPLLLLPVPSPCHCPGCSRMASLAH